MDQSETSQFKTEGQPAFPVANEGKETPPESAAGKETTPAAEGTPGEGGEGGKKDDKDAGLLEHPRWKEREDEWNTRFNTQETRFADMLTKQREELEAKFGQKPASPASPATPEKPPEWFGGDEAAWAAYKQHESDRISEGVKSVLEQQQKDQKEQEGKQAELVKQATTFMQTELAAIEADKTLNPKGVKIDVNKLLKFTMDNELVDTKGNWNYRAAFKMMGADAAAAVAEATQEKKDLAAATTSDRGGGSDRPSSVTTSQDFKKPGAKPW